MGHAPIPHEVDVASLIERCREFGLKVTPQRLAVYRAVLLTDAHPSPDDVYNAVRVEMPSISLATVYKSLDALEEVGLVSQVALPSEAKRYDANLDPHHHLICTGCRRIMDLIDPSLDLEPPPKLRGFRAVEVRVQVLGLCDSCGGAGRVHAEENNA